LLAPVSHATWQCVPLIHKLVSSYMTLKQETGCINNGCRLAHTEIKHILHVLTMATIMNYVMPSQWKFYKWRTIHSSHFTAFS